MACHGSRYSYPHREDSELSSAACSPPHCNPRSQPNRTTSRRTTHARHGSPSCRHHSSSRSLRVPVDTGISPLYARDAVEGIPSPGPECSTCCTTRWKGRMMVEDNRVVGVVGVLRGRDGQRESRGNATVAIPMPPRRRRRSLVSRRDFASTTSRNAMTVVRGRAQQIADTAGGVRQPRTTRRCGRRRRLGRSGRRRHRRAGRGTAVDEREGPPDHRGVERSTGDRAGRRRTSGRGGRGRDRRRVPRGIGDRVDSGRDSPRVGDNMDRPGDRRTGPERDRPPRPRVADRRDHGHRG